MNSTLAEILQEEKASTEARQQAAQAAYHKLVKAIAQEAKIPVPAERAAVLSAAGKSLDDLSRDVATSEEVIRDRAIVAKLATHPARRQQALARLEAADAKFEAAHNEHTAATLPLREELLQIECEAFAAHDARIRLLRIDDPTACAAPHSRRRGPAAHPIV